MEIDKNRYNIAKRNFKRNHLKNVEIINGDALDENLIEYLKNVNIIFSDPSRPRKNEEYTLEDLSPSPLKIIEKYKNKNFAFDVPVQINTKKIPDIFEKEYISIKGEIKRLSLYLGEIKKYEKSALILPSEIRMVKNENIDREIPISNEIDDFIYEIDPAIWYADLLPEFFNEFKKLHLILKDKKRALATGPIEYVDERFKNVYKKFFIAENLEELKNKLLENNAGKVFLRYPIYEDYYKTKAELEKNLKGDLIFYIFLINGKFVGSVRS